MKKLILIRHAKTVIDPHVSAKDWKLSEDAFAASRVLAEELQPYNLNRIVTSEEVKASETGHIIAEQLQLPCETASNLHEHDRTDVPFITEQAWMSTLQAFFKKPDELVFGRETANQALARFEHAVKDVLQHYPDETLGVVSHGTVMSLFVAKHNDLDILEFWQLLKMPDVVVLSLPDFKRIT